MRFRNNTRKKSFGNHHSRMGYQVTVMPALRRKTLLSKPIDFSTTLCTIYLAINAVRRLAPSETELKPVPRRANTLSSSIVYMLVTFHKGAQRDIIRPSTFTMGYLLLIFSTIAIALFSSPLFKLLRNYNEARRFGLPILITPISVLSPVWTLSQHFAGPILERLPFGLGGFVLYSGFAWMFKARHSFQEKYGPAFIIVTPEEIELIIADAEASDDVLNRRKDFIKPEKMYQPLEIFGPNVDTVNGEDWQRHRRITTPPFNERNSSHVWRESLSQASGMLKSWTATRNEAVTSLTADTLTLALHVLTSAGFGKSYAFDSGLTTLSDGHTLSYRDSLRKILDNIFGSIIITSVGLPPALLPRKLKELKTAISEFREYMFKMVEEEKSSVKHVDAEKDNLLSVLVRISEREGESKGRNGLTDQEIFGNLFIYNLAGHETTANTLAYAITLIASDLHLQEWIREELQSVFGDQENVETWEYQKAFPKLVRCLALMYETIRLYPPVFVIPKYTGEFPTTITIRGKKCHLPARTYVAIDVTALNTLPEYWGSDSLVWRPDRWIETDSGSEQLYQPPPGVFLAWASGPRVCPGKKFAQVEFVAVVAKLFRHHQARPVLNPGETSADAKKRILETAEDSNIVIALQMKHPERVKLIWEEV